MSDNLFCPSPKGATWAGWALLKVCPGLISEKKKTRAWVEPNPSCNPPPQPEPNLRVFNRLRVQLVLSPY